MTISAPRTHHFSCRIVGDSAGLERLLQVVRRRGFVAERVQAVYDAGGIDVDMTIIGQRAPETLAAQIARLHTVQRVNRHARSMSSPAPREAPAPMNVAC